MRQLLGANTFNRLGAPDMAFLREKK
jgi:hypothetical protein